MDFITVKIPAHLEEAFEHFVELCTLAVDESTMDDWGKDEREIYEWMRDRKWDEEFLKQDVDS